MIGLLCFVLAVLASPFKSKLRLEAENAVLRHQSIVLRRRLHGPVRFTNNDRWFEVLTIIRPETLVLGTRAGFRCYCRWKSRPQGGRPQIDTELRVPPKIRRLGATIEIIEVRYLPFWPCIDALDASGQFGGCGGSRNMSLQNPPGSLLADD